MKSPFLKFLVFGLFISFFACGDSPLDGVEDLFAEYKTIPVLSYLELKTRISELLK